MTDYGVSDTWQKQRNAGVNSLVEEQNITAAQWGGLISPSSILHEHTLISYISKKETLSNGTMSEYI